jgi:hypothetical protein
MPRGLRRAAFCLLAVGATWSLTLGGTVSAYTGSVTTSSNTFAGAPDWTAPTVASAVVGRSTAYDTGLIAQGASYYVYANVGDTGNPASGIASVTANVGSITSGSTAVALTAGSYSGGGTAYGYRSAALAAGASLSVGSHSYTITSTDSGANAATQTFNTTVDNTAPSAVDLQSTNVSGGTVGQLELGDTLTLTTSKAIDPYSILPGWSGASTSVQVRMTDAGGVTSDYLTFYNNNATPTQIPLGTVTLGSAGYAKMGVGNYVTYGATGTPTTMTRSGSTITIVLGTPTGTPSTSTALAAMTWTPSTTATDIAGNADTATVATQSGTAHNNF